MAKGNAVLKIAGILLALFGILNVLWSMMFGFIGAKGYWETEQHVLVGLLIFYGVFGILTGIFQIGVSSVCIRYANAPKRWLRCFIWGIVILVLGIITYLALFATAGMIGKGTVFYPPWFGFCIVAMAGVILPVMAMIGGLLNKVSACREDPDDDGSGAEGSMEAAPSAAANERAR